MTKKIIVKYFAALREQRGCSDEEIETTASTYLDLYNELASKHGLKLKKGHIKLAVNQCYEDLDTPIQEADVATFIPPVAGG